MRITVNGDHIQNPYIDSITSMVETEIPGSAKGNRGALLDVVSMEMVGTKQHRFGPTPDPETHVAIRDVVRNAMDRQEPIPVLIPWGASKQGPWGVDLAEVMALKQLKCLDQRVTRHYEPGVSFRIRLEDLTDGTMFDGVDGWADKTKKYVQKFLILHNVSLQGGTDVPKSQVVLESEMMDEVAHRDFVDVAAPFFHAAMQMPQYRREGYIKSEFSEWSGHLPDEQLNFYRKAYATFYPGEIEYDRDARLSRYFAGAIGRFMLKGTGALPSWGGKYLTLSFTGIPWSKAGRRIYYRTIPEKYTNQHRAPWIGKGYVRIHGRDATPAISGWNGDGLEFNQTALTVSRGDASVEVDADYVVMS